MHESFRITEKGELQKYLGKASQLVIPDEVKVIGAMAFYQCAELKEVILPPGIRRIGAGAFCDCLWLETINFPGSIVEIGPGAFKNCVSLEIVQLGQGIETIGPRAFMGCSALHDVILPQSIRQIAKDAFADCPLLKKDSISTGKSIGSGHSFNNISRQVSKPRQEYATLRPPALIFSEPPPVNPSHRKFAPVYGSSRPCSMAQQGIELGNPSAGDISIQSALQQPDKSDTPVQDEITVDANSAYAIQDDKREIMQEESISDCFTFDCTGTCLESYHGKEATVILPAEVEIVGPRAFTGNTSIVKVILGENMKTISRGAFFECSNLNCVCFSGTLSEIESFAFEDCAALTSIEIPEGVEELPESCFFNCVSLQAVSIPQSLQIIGASAFRNCAALTEVTLSAKLSEIRDRAFAGCSSLTKVTADFSKIKIGENIFAGTNFVVPVITKQELSNPPKGVAGGAERKNAKRASSRKEADDLKAKAILDTLRAEEIIIRDMLGEYYQYLRSDSESAFCDSFIKELVGLFGMRLHVNNAHDFKLMSKFETPVAIATLSFNDYPASHAEELFNRRNAEIGIVSIRTLIRFQREHMDIFFRDIAEGFRIGPRFIYGEIASAATSVDGFSREKGQFRTFFNLMCELAVGNYS